MIFSIIIIRKEIEVGVKKENLNFPIKIWLEDITISLSAQEALELGGKLEQAYQDLNIELDEAHGKHSFHNGVCDICGKREDNV